MTPQQIVGLAIRLFALWIATRSFVYIFSLPGVLASSSLGEQAMYSYLIGITYLFGAALLWFFPMWIAHKIVPRTSFENKLNLQALEAARVGCSLIGLGLFAKALPDIVWFLLRAFLVVGNESVFRSMDTDARLNFAATCVELVFALLLIVRSSDFARLVIREQRPKDQH